MWLIDRLSRCLRLLLLAVLASVLPGCLGCAGEGIALDGAPASALRRSFPEQAGRVLEHHEAFVATSDGFALRRPKGPWRTVEATLPAWGAGAITLESSTGFEVQLREEGMLGQGALAGSAVAYGGASRTSFWTPAPGSVEHWLHLAAGTVTRGEPAATWRVSGASLRQHGDAVEVIGPTGAVELYVSAPAAYAASGRTVSARLASHGAEIDLVVEPTDEELLVDPQWTAVAPMNDARGNHLAFLLQTGAVLVAGGTDPSGNSLGSAELYDVAANTWTQTPPMTTARGYPAGALLADGRVLVAGGDGSTTAEIYDPSTNAWTATVGSMSQSRNQGTAVTLASGKVLIVGGQSPVTANAEVYDPSTGSFSLVAPMSTPRLLAGMSLLADGRALVAGGYDGSAYVDTAEVYDPAADTWTLTGTLPFAEPFVLETLLPDGTVVASANALQAGIYSPVTNNWTATGNMTNYHFQGEMTTLSNGSALLAGDVGGATAETYSPLNGWVAQGTIPGLSVRFFSGITSIGMGALVSGGEGPGTYGDPSCAIFALACSTSADCSGYACETAGCVGGFCSLTPVTCTPLDSCHVAGTCDPVLGCSNPLATDGTTCNDNDACTPIDTCQAGVCTGQNPVLCPTPGVCHVAGTCDPSTGTCSNPVAVGASCNDGNRCTTNDVCDANGVCAGTAVTCPESTPCQVSNTCDLGTGACIPSSKGDGNPCPGGTCYGGTCLLDSSISSGSAAASSGSTSITSGTSGSAAGSSGSAVASSGSAVASSASGSSGTGGAGNGAGGSAGAIQFQGNGCSTGGSSSDGRPWLLLGLLLLARRRRMS